MTLIGAGSAVRDGGGSLGEAGDANAACSRKELLCESRVRDHPHRHPLDRDGNLPLRGALSSSPLTAADTHHHILYGAGELKSSIPKHRYHDH
jgi:hypothetical protein